MHPTIPSENLPRSPRPHGLSAAEHVYRYLKRLIVTLSIEPETVLTEMMVSSAVDLSRTPIREAFLRLEAEKLVTLIPRSGALVAPVRMREIRAMNEARAVIERYAAERICEQGVPVEPALQRLVGLQREATEREPHDLHAILELDRRFHQSLIEAIENQELSDLYSSFGDRQVRFGIAMFQVEPARSARALDGHEKILAALSERDPEKCKLLIDQHLLHHLSYLGDAFVR